jgi:hypothetical protein
MCEPFRPEWVNCGLRAHDETNMVNFQSIGFTRMDRGVERRPTLDLLVALVRIRARAAGLYSG